MKRVKVLRIGIAIGMAFLLLLTSVACGTSSKSGNETKEVTSTSSQTNASQTTEQTTVAKKPVKLVIGGQEGLAAPDPDAASYKQDIMKEFEKITGIELEFQKYTADQLKLALAGGDLPDLLMVYNTLCKQLLDGNKVIAMDPYLANHGKNILKVSDKRIALTKKSNSKNGDNQLYFVTSYADSQNGIANTNLGFFPPSGYDLRWDVYKDIGCPTFKNDDEFIQVLQQMKVKYPKTPEGKPTYAYGLHTTFGVFMYHIRDELINGTYHWTWPNPYLATVDTNELVNNFGDVNSPLWRDIKFYNKINKLGLLDPDSFTMKYEDTNARSKALQYLASPGHGGPADPGATDKNHPLAYYANIPAEGAFIGINTVNEVGWTDRVFCITTKCKEPERAVDLIDAFNDPEMVRLLSSGIQGVHWDYVDGKPQMKQEFIDMKKNAATDTAVKEKYDKIGFEWGGSCLWGISAASYCKDGAIIDLWRTPETYKATMTDFEKDYCNYYKVAYPMEIFEKAVKDGKMKDYSKQNYNIPGSLQNPTDEIKRIDTDIDSIMIRYIPKLILAKTDDEFNKVQAEALDKLGKANIDKSWQWWKNNWDTAKNGLVELGK